MMREEFGVRNARMNEAEISLWVRLMVDMLAIGTDVSSVSTGAGVVLESTAVIVNGSANESVSVIVDNQSDAIVVWQMTLEFQRHKLPAAKQLGYRLARTQD